MRYVVEHELHLRFAEPVFEHQCEVRLLPSTTASQRVLSAVLTTEPNAKQSAYVDCFGNQVHHFDVADAHEALVTRTRVEVETLLANPFDYVPIAPERERAWIAEALRAQPRLWDFVLHRSPATPHAEVLSDAELRVPALSADRPLVEGVIALRDWIADSFAYRTARGDSKTAVTEVVAARAGDARDFAHLLITMVRGWGVPARYVSGYQDRDDDDAEGDEGATEPQPHAWAEVLVPGAGWRGFDATARLMTSDTYVCVAVGRDVHDTLSQRCTFKGASEGEPAKVAVRLARQQ